MQVQVEGNLPDFESLADLSPIMEKIMEHMVASVTRNFDEGGRPRWQALATGQPSLLRKSGALKGSIRGSFGKDFAEVEAGRGLPYARIHQYGGETHPVVSERMKAFFWRQYRETGTTMWKALALKYSVGDALTIKIVARPYMMFQEEDVEWMVNNIPAEIVKQVKFVKA